MDKVVGTVPRGIVCEAFFEQGSLRVFLGRFPLAQIQPLAFDSWIVQNSSDSSADQLFLLCSFRHNLVLKAKNQFAIDHFDRQQALLVLIALIVNKRADMWLNQGKTALLVVILAVILRCISGHQTEADRAAIVKLEAVV